MPVLFLEATLVGRQSLPKMQCNDILVKALVTSQIAHQMLVVPCVRLVELCEATNWNVHCLVIAFADQLHRCSVTRARVSRDASERA